MRALFFLALLFAGFSVRATYLPLNETLTVGGRSINPNKTGFKMLVGVVGQTSNWSTLRETNSSSGYTVPASKTFKIVAVEFVTSAVSGPIGLAYGDNDVGLATATVPTNVVYSGGDSALYMLRTGAASETRQAAYLFSVPTGKYPAIYEPGGGGGTTGEVKVFGYEE